MATHTRCLLKQSCDQKLPNIRCIPHHFQSFVDLILNMQDSNKRKEESLTYKALCLALLDKYYGHQHYRIHFAHAKLQCQNGDAWLRNCFNLIDTYTREEIKVKFILDCLHTEL